MRIRLIVMWLNYSVENRSHFFKGVGGAHPGRKGFGHDVEVPAADQGMALRSKGLPYDPFDPVAAGSLGHLFGNGNSQPRLGGLSRPVKYQEVAGVDLFTAAGQENEFTPFEQPVGFGEFAAQRHRPDMPAADADSGLAGHDQTARRFLPFARRRLITLRPFLVDIRFRNPWVRARRILLG